MNDTSALFEGLQAAKPIPHQEDEYRLYYEGETPICVSPEKLDGDFIPITKEQFYSLDLSKIRIRDKKIELIPNEPVSNLVLVPDKNGEYVTTPNNMIFLAEEGDRYSVLPEQLDK